MSQFINELKRRNVIKASIAYVVVAWILLQAVSIILPIVNAPEWVLKMFTFFLAIGFPIWVIFSWVYEVTPEGLKKTAQVSKNQSVTTTTNKRLNILILVGLVIAIIVNFFNKPTFDTSNNSIESANVQNSIAVLYFDDISSGGDTEWFCDGVTEDILTNLSKIKELTVISKTSTKRYKNTDKSIPEIAAELGVSYIVEGSVRRHEDKVRKVQTDGVGLCCSAC
jgi:TolB-like protein